MFVACNRQKKKDVMSCLDQTKQRTIGSHNSMGAHAEPKKNRTQKTKENTNIELGTGLDWLADRTGNFSPRAKREKEKEKEKRKAWKGQRWRKGIDPNVDCFGQHRLNAPKEKKQRKQRKQEQKKSDIHLASAMSRRCCSPSQHLTSVPDLCLDGLCVDLDASGGELDSDG